LAQGALDVAGLVPGLGEPADALNGVIWMMRGDCTAAALSFAAMVPVAGWAATAGKAGKRGLRWADEAADLTRKPRRVLFGQKRVDPKFSKEGFFAGREISDVVSDLKAGRLTPADLPIQAFIDPKTGELVSVNTRSLAALSEAGLRPTHVTIIKPKQYHVRRLDEIPIIPHAPLPGPRVPVTPSQSDLTVLRIIELP
jgi:hypothetical protein